MEVTKFCEEQSLFEKFDFAIQHTYDAWIGDLEYDDVDRLILTGLKTALRADGVWLVRIVKERYSLPATWTGDDANWELFREAIAVTLLQAFYDS
jgi:hypothetical protein